jgi:tRNA modification GTPase
MLIYRAPHSYTREDVVEIQGHGGGASARRTLRTLLDAGARLAEPGEFTKRAFLSGRIDLLQAEAVSDLIRARTDRAATSAIEQLEGGLSTAFVTRYDRLLSIASDLEAALDFPDHDFPEDLVANALVALEQIIPELQDAADSWDEGHLLREGALVVIAGPTNAGKSTLLNALLDRPRAIVAAEPGTTRDTIEEGLVLNGFPIRLADTAGLRATACTIEQEGIARANSYINRAHLELYVLDASSPLESPEQVDARSADSTVLVLNKTDLGNILRPDQFPGHTAIPCSLTAGEGLEEVRQSIIQKLHLRPAAPQLATVSERHRAVLLKAQCSASEARDLLSKSHESNVVLAVSCLRDAIYALGTATGRTYQTELLDRIFSNFCIGK